MPTSQMINEWFDRGIALKATHMIIVCDAFDYDHYPVYVKKNENVKEKEAEYRSKEMQRVMEIYNLNLDKNTQLNQQRSFNY